MSVWLRRFWFWGLDENHLGVFAYHTCRIPLTARGLWLWCAEIWACILENRSVFIHFDVGCGASDSPSCLEFLPAHISQCGRVSRLSSSLRESATQSVLPGNGNDGLESGPAGSIQLAGFCCGKGESRVVGQTLSFVFWYGSHVNHKINIKCELQDVSFEELETHLSFKGGMVLE